MSEVTRSRRKVLVGVKTSVASMICGLRPQNQAKISNSATCIPFTVYEFRLQVWVAPQFIGGRFNSSNQKNAPSPRYVPPSAARRGPWARCRGQG
jgi:hypothetical protein